MIYNPAMYRAALTFAWLVGTIYATIPLFWLMVHPFAHLLRARRSLYYVIIPSWFVMMTVIYALSWRSRVYVLYHTPVAWLAAAFLFASAIFIYQRSRLNLSRGQQRQLVTSGIRQRIRHPIYLAHLFMLLAWTVGSGEVVLYGLTAFALLTGWPMIRQEEDDLERRFGDEYRAYKSAVPEALIPRISRFAKARRN